MSKINSIKTTIETTLGIIALIVAVIGIIHAIKEISNENEKISAKQPIFLHFSENKSKWVTTKKRILSKAKICKKSKVKANFSKITFKVRAARTIQFTIHILHIPNHFLVISKQWLVSRIAEINR